MLIKNSLFFLFRRIFSPLPRSKILIHCGIILTTVSYTVLFVVWLVYGVPHADDSGWDDPVFAQKVGRESPKISVALGSVSTFTDYYVIAVPLSTISGLKLSKGKKIGVSVVFATGLL